MCVCVCVCVCVCMCMCYYILSVAKLKLLPSHIIKKIVKNKYLFINKINRRKEKRSQREEETAQIISIGLQRVEEKENCNG